MRLWVLQLQPRCVSFCRSRERKSGNRRLLRRPAHVLLACLPSSHASVHLERTPSHAQAVGESKEDQARAAFAAIEKPVTEVSAR